MIKAYLNYPNPHMTLHSNSGCHEIAKMTKPNQRSLSITPVSFAHAVGELTTGSFRLGADASINDIWFSVDFKDIEFEEAVARYIYRTLGQRYTRLRGTPTRHC